MCKATFAAESVSFPGSVCLSGLCPRHRRGWDHPFPTTGAFLAYTSASKKHEKQPQRREPPSHCSSPHLELSFSVDKPRNSLFGKKAIATARNPWPVFKTPLPEQRKNNNSSIPEDLYSCDDMPRRPEATKGWLKKSHIHFSSSRRCSNICQDLVHRQTLCSLLFLTC